MPPPPDPSAAAPDPGAGSEPGAGSKPGGEPGSIRGLLVDDRDGPRERAARTLRRALPHVALEVAASRAEGLALLDRGPFAFAVLRNGMAWGGGLSLPHALHERLPGVPLILTCDPDLDEAPDEAQDPAGAARLTTRHGLDRAVAVAGDDVAAVTAAVETVLKLNEVRDERDHLAGERDDLADERDHLADERNGLVGERNGLARDLRRSERKVVALLRAAEKHAGREAAARRRLARVLHEDMLQLLVGARMFLSCAAPDGGGGDDDGAGEALGEVDSLLIRSIQLCKDLTGLWSPMVLYEAGLVAALRWLEGPREGAVVPDLPPREDADDDPHGGIAGEPDLGPIPAGLIVSVDCDDGAEPDTQDGRILLYHAAVELLANVARHSGADRADLALRLRPADDPGGDQDRGALLELTVRDRGRGFDFDTDRDDPTDPPPPADAGTGAADRFGLFGLRERLALAGGRLEIESVSGEGSTVRALLPRASGRRADRPFFADSADADPAGANSPGHDNPDAPVPDPAGGADPAAPPLRVLIADDNRIIQVSVGAVLARAPDVEIVGQAADGAEAVAKTLELAPDVVLMDVSMPVLDGVEATRRVKAVAPGTRVIALSMHESDGRERDMFEAGAERYVVKDGPPELLLHALRNPPDGATG